MVPGWWWCSTLFTKYRSTPYLPTGSQLHSVEHSFSYLYVLLIFMRDLLPTLDSVRWPLSRKLAHLRLRCTTESILSIYSTARDLLFRCFTVSPVSTILSRMILFSALISYTCTVLVQLWRGVASPRTGFSWSINYTREHQSIQTASIPIDCALFTHIWYMLCSKVIIGFHFICFSPLRSPVRSRSHTVYLWGSGPTTWWSSGPGLIGRPIVPEMPTLVGSS